MINNKSVRCNKRVGTDEIINGKSNTAFKKKAVVLRGDGRGERVR